MISFLILVVGFALLWMVSPLAGIGCACVVIGFHMAAKQPTPTPTPTGDER